MNDRYALLRKIYGVSLVMGITALLALGADRAAADQVLTISDLGTLPGGTFSVGTGITRRDEVVGYALTSSQQYHAFLYRDGVMTDLGALPGGSNSYATSIDNDWHVSGVAYTAGGAGHAVVWTPAH
ncbi:extracellular repeat protein, HAF family [Burkholderia sp. lig30]|jgi:probable HAF family extracellular repeat protein|uniref:hypothetical protein n=1 Tax=Burkholderia sp. lig30 TaxID=1192124 RepID=UPI000461FCD1|nr:hypothetical protein [Burkholderia sp. lig30]KDB08088.1 extracellular repeat protein, HAF family [Burkholderia sp. lig30]